MYKINYKIVSETNFNKYLHCGTSGNEYVDTEMGGNNGSEKMNRKKHCGGNNCCLQTE